MWSSSDWDASMKALKWLIGIAVIVIFGLGILFAMLFLGAARAEGADLLIRSSADLLPNPPATDANQNTLLAQNPVVLLILALAVGGGIPATRWATQYAREFFTDAGIELNSLGMRLLGLASGVGVSTLLEALGMYQAAELQTFPAWLRIVGLGLAFGVMAGGLHDASRRVDVYTTPEGQFGDGDLPDSRQP